MHSREGQTGGVELNKALNLVEWLTGAALPLALFPGQLQHSLMEEIVQEHGPAGGITRVSVVRDDPYP